nr:MAG TPA: YopX protein [Caudoviricetes sp.]
MREILFKAKRLDNGEWVEGYYIGPIGVLDVHEICDVHDITGPRVEVDPSTVCEYTNIDIRREAWPSSEVHKIFTGDMLGEWGEDEDGNECVCILGAVTYWEDEGRYVLADEDGLCNDWTLEDEAKPENWPHLIHCGNIHDGEGGND